MDGSVLSGSPRNRLAGRLAIVGGALALVGAGTGAFGVFAIYRYYGMTPPLGGFVSFTVCSGVAFGVLGGVAIWMGRLALAGRPIRGTALGIIGIVLMVGAFLFIWWIPATVGGFFVLVSAILTKSIGST